MDELVCLNCGKEMEYDWAPCPHCGWKPPESWEESAEEPIGESHAILSKPRKWIYLTAWILLAAALAWILLYLYRFLR
jgi:hypothetical protein